MINLAPFEVSNEDRLDDLLLIRIGCLAKKMNASPSLELTEFLAKEMALLTKELSPSGYAALGKAMGVQLTK